MNNPSLSDFPAVYIKPNTKPLFACGSTGVIGGFKPWYKFETFVRKTTEIEIAPK